MGQAIGGSLPLAVGIALSPIPIIAVVLMLSSRRAKVNGPAFVLGWLIGLGIVGVIVLSLAGPAGASQSGSPAAWVSWVKILDNITLYWLTNTGVSASRLYWEYRGGFLNAKGVSHPGGRDRLSRRAVPSAAQLGRAGLPQPPLLQPSRQGRPLRRLGTAATLFRRGSRGVPGRFVR
jgi:hypothetical protein